MKQMCNGFARSELIRDKVLAIPDEVLNIAVCNVPICPNGLDNPTQIPYRKIQVRILKRKAKKMHCHPSVSTMTGNDSKEGK